MTRRQRPSDSRNSATVILLFVFLAMAVGLVLFLSLIIPGALGFLAVVAGIALVGGIHYLLWGWWMPGSGPSDDDSPR